MIQPSTPARLSHAISELRFVLKRRSERTVTYKGIKLRIDRPKGHVQTGTGPDGKAWTRTYKWDYGYIAGTQGGDGDGLDVFVGPHPDHPLVHWVIQLKADGSFDEYKCMLGFTSRQRAKDAYLAHVPKQFYGGMTTTTVAMLKAALGIDPEESLPHPLAKRGSTAEGWAKDRGLLESKDPRDRGFAEAIVLLEKQAPRDLLLRDLERWDEALTVGIVRDRCHPSTLAAERAIMAKLALRKTDPSARTVIAKAMLDTFDGTGSAEEQTKGDMTSADLAAGGMKVPDQRHRRERRVVDCVTKRVSTAALLLEAGPPMEWSGAVAAVLGPRKDDVIALWEALDERGKELVQAAFERAFDDDGQTEETREIERDLKQSYPELAKAAAKSVAISKLDEEKRLVYGIVLEPDGVDAQNDTISPEEIEAAAHLYLEHFRNVGIQHKRLANHLTRVVESYIAPVDFDLGGQNVRKGTWVLVVKILDDELWLAVKAGEFTGFSIEGVATVDQLTSEAPYQRAPVT